MRALVLGFVFASLLAFVFVRVYIGACVSAVVSLSVFACDVSFFVRGLVCLSSTVGSVDRSVAWFIASDAQPYPSLNGDRGLQRGVGVFDSIETRFIEWPSGSRGIVVMRVDQLQSTALVSNSAAWHGRNRAESTKLGEIEMSRNRKKPNPRRAELHTSSS